jgi:uncharacterized protein YndB with AHSA1/START domain
MQLHLDLFKNRHLFKNRQKKSFIVICAVLLWFTPVLAQQAERTVYAEIVIGKGIEAVWNAWTTEDGVRSFFAPDCQIESRAGGDYEIYFNPAGEKGKRGAEGTKILALQAPTMLSFTWNNPPHLPGIRWQYTAVVVRLERLSEDSTRVTLSQGGWGTGKEWDDAFKYFGNAWQKQVLPFLKHSLETGPVDWKNPPK